MIEHSTNDPHVTDGPIHEWFGLSYSNYLVLPRTLLQSMPTEWQERFVACLDEIEAAFMHVEHAHAYKVTPGVEREASRLCELDRRLTGVTYEDGQFHDEDGREVPPWARVLVPREDPVPHYDRGRTFIPPRIGTVET